jgi:hypothetical protein
MPFSFIAFIKTQKQKDRGRNGKRPPRPFLLQRFPFPGRPRSKSGPFCRAFLHPLFFRIFVKAETFSPDTGYLLKRINEQECRFRFISGSEQLRFPE